MIYCYSPYPTFNKLNTFKAYRDEVADLPDDHDPTDLHQAIKAAASEDPLYLGVLYRQEGESFEDHIIASQTGADEDAPKVLEDLFQRYA